LREEIASSLGRGVGHESMRAMDSSPRCLVIYGGSLLQSKPVMEAVQCVAAKAMAWYFYLLDESFIGKTTR